jgi:hypothetical protein
MARNLIVILLFSMSWWLRRPIPDNPSGAAVGFSLVAVLLALVTAWLGGELVDRPGVGVDRGANLNSPTCFPNRLPLSKRNRQPSGALLEMSDDHKQEIMGAQDATTLAQKVENLAQAVAGRGSEVATQMQSKVSEVSGKICSSVHQIDESTVPDSFRKMPKLISPRIHAWLDVAVTGYFAALGVWFGLRGKRAPATAAFVTQAW